MKKYLVILGALLMVAGSAFGQGTILNQDSCDISVSPAATMLLPYFSVDPAGETTLVTITNVSDVPAVAHFTVWTNLSYPVLDFNVFLTGYDVQGISLTDVLVNGTVPSTGTPTTLSPTGARSLNNVTGNANSQGGNWALTCANNQGGTGVIPPGLLSAVQSALTGGGYFSCAAGRVSNPTETMVGYITIDVVDICSQDLPTSDTVNYFATQMLHDNQLIGDYIRIDGVGGVSGASPLVHIKSVPFGGPAQPAVVPTTFPRTFYDRYQRTTNLNLAGVASYDDARQPLPSVFAARYIEPGTALNFDTNLTIWRQGITNLPGTNCTASGVVLNDTSYVEIVRFDEHENPRTFAPEFCTISPCEDPDILSLPETSSIGITSAWIPPDTSTSDPGGWLYMNMADSALDVIANYGPTMSWVQIRMTAAGLFGVDFDAAYMSNGCSAFQPLTSTGLAAPKIGPHHN